MEFYDASMEAAEEEGLLPACSSGLHSPVSSAATLGAWVRYCFFFDSFVYGV